MTAPPPRRSAHRAVKTRPCPRCHNPVLTGPDAGTCALPAQADPIPVSELGEALALLDNRRTYDYVRSRTAPELEYREEWTISGPRRFPVLAEHKCGQPPLPADTSEEKQPEASDEPGF